MSFELHQLFLISLGYLLLLFSIAHITERGWVPEKLVRHPLTFVLSLGVFASAWAIYGVVGLAHEYGYGFLSYYLGLAATFLFAPLVLMPILRISQRFLHSSLADLLTFRYRSQWAGSLVTIFMLIAVLPLLALQIQAVSDTVHILTAEQEFLSNDSSRHDGMALVFCLIICLFTISFGSRQLTAHDRHNGLVAAIAFESLVKLLAMLGIGAAVMFGVFDGFNDLDQWLLANPDMVALLHTPAKDNVAQALLLIFFSAAVATPHLFHMIFAENPNTRAIRTASWGVPLFLLLMSLPILPILWSGFKLETALPPEYFTLAVGIELDSPLLATLTYIGGLSAASGLIIVTTLALASMCLKHLILPVYRPDSNRDIYHWLLWIRRTLIVCIILLGYMFYRFIVGREALSSLGLSSFIAAIQFLPGVLAALYWQNANGKGFIAGLICGFSVWFFTLLIPIVSEFDAESIGLQFFDIPRDDFWSTITILSLALNTLVFIIVSAVTTTSEEEKAAAEVCSTDDLSRPVRRSLSVTSPSQITQQLSTALGNRTAAREVGQALKELQLNENESRPFALRRLRYRVEANLSGLLGPSVAHDMVNQLLPFENHQASSGSEDINLIEVQLENYKVNLTGLAADLDNLRRYHRQTLQDLPVGACSLGQDGEILMWNSAMAVFTGIESSQVIGSNLASLPPPWGQSLSSFSQSPQPHLYKQSIKMKGATLWFNLHKTARETLPGQSDGRVIVLEDTTDLQMLERELTHSERLASIGRLAAGVAHEIGNPVTAIACLAQNLRYDTDNPESLEAGMEILNQTERVSKIVQTLVNFAHSGSDGSSHEQAPIKLSNCVDEAIHLLLLNKGAKPAHFENRCTTGSTVMGNAQQLLQVFVNLLSNARDASDAEAPIYIDEEINDRYIRIHVTDQGTGINKEDLERIFEPFFTTKEAGHGTGLGLSLVYSIVEDMNGYISVESPVEQQRGTRFSLQLQRYIQGQPTKRNN